MSSTPNADDVCCACGRSADRSLNERGKFKVELRPYGPGGQPICFECATSTPEAEEQTKRAFGAILDGAQAMGGGVASITDHGIEPGIPNERTQADG